MRVFSCRQHCQSQGTNPSSVHASSRQFDPSQMLAFEAVQAYNRSLLWPRYTHSNTMAPTHLRTRPRPILTRLRCCRCILCAQTSHKPQGIQYHEIRLWLLNMPHSISDSVRLRQCHTRPKTAPTQDRWLHRGWRQRARCNNPSYQSRLVGSDTDCFPIAHLCTGLNLGHSTPRLASLHTQRYRAQLPPPTPLFAHSLIHKTVSFALLTSLAPDSRCFSKLSSPMPSQP
jgi:hypothetical protein